MMEYMHLAFRAFASAAALALISSSASGQLRTESHDLVTRQRCSVTIGAIGARLTPSNAPRLTDLHECDESSGVVLSRLWTSTGLGADELNHLVYASSLVHDSRTADAVIAVVRDTQRPTAERAAALTVLANYLDSSWVGGVSNEQGRIVVRVSLHTHPASRQGSHPITQAYRAKVISFVDQLRQTEPMGEVRGIAEIISGSLRLRSARRPAR